jgi:MerR family transcriptional regulator, copper efflux regulator
MSTKFAGLSGRSNFQANRPANNNWIAIRFCLTLEPVPGFKLSAVRSKDGTKSTLYAGELAHLAGVSTDTLRHYERSGLMVAAPRSASGYRLYPSDALHRVRLIRGALSIGFSTDELSAILRERDRGGAPCQRVRRLAREKLNTLKTQLRNLKVRERQLRKILIRWDQLLRKTRRGAPAGLLESLIGVQPRSVAPDNRLRRIARHRVKGEERK